MSSMWIAFHLCGMYQDVRRHSGVWIGVQAALECEIDSVSEQFDMVACDSDHLMLDRRRHALSFPRSSWGTSPRWRALKRAAGPLHSYLWVGGRNAS